jgi:hypothetical protein
MSTDRDIAMLRRDIERLQARVPLRQPAGGTPAPVRLRMGRGNQIWASTGSLRIYGAKGGINPTAVSAGMWNSTTKAWIPADATWDNGIGYAYTDSGSVVAVAPQFNGVAGLVLSSANLTEGAIFYSQTTTTYVLGADTLTIYLPDFF